MHHESMVIAANLKVELSLFCNMVLLFSTTDGKFICLSGLCKK